MSILADQLTLSGHSIEIIQKIIPLVKEYGAVLVRGFLPRDLVEAIDREGVEAQVRGLDVGKIPNEFNGPANALTDETLTELFQHCIRTGLVQSMAEYIGDDELVVLLEQGPFGVRDRRPQRGDNGPLLGVGWHQDITPNASPKARRMIAMWCPLTPSAGLRSPGLAVITQPFDSEWWKGQMDRGYFEPRMQVLEDRYRDYIWKPVYEPGDVLFFDHLSFHGTCNLPEHDQVRRSVDFRFEGAANTPLDRLEAHTRVMTSRTGRIESVEDWKASSPSVRDALQKAYELRARQAGKIMELVDAGRQVALWAVNPLVRDMVVENPAVADAVASGRILLVDRNTDARAGIEQPVHRPEALAGFSGTILICAVDPDTASAIRKAASSLADRSASILDLQLQYYKEA